MNALDVVFEWPIQDNAEYELEGVYILVQHVK